MIDELNQETLNSYLAKRYGEALVFYCPACRTGTHHLVLRVGGALHGQFFCEVYHPPVPNAPLGNKVLDQLRLYPLRHDQQHWLGWDGEYNEDGYISGFTPEVMELDAEGNQTGSVRWMEACGTTACFAGHAALLDGIQVDVRGKPHVNGIEVDIESYARTALGLTPAQAEELFVNTCNRANPEEAAIKLATSIFGGEL